MPRKKRIWYPGATYHVMSRGNRRASIYKDGFDHDQFLEYLKMVKDSYPFTIHAMCLMTNHFHLLIETRNTDLSKVMQKFLSLYATDYNQRYGLTGHLFESRYTACLIEDERYFLEVSRYIHLNPVKAMMVREPMDYEYSSYGCFVSQDVKSEGPSGIKATKNKWIRELVETDRVLSAFRNNAREQYRMFVEGKISHEEQELLIQKDMKEDEMWLPW